jgi:hypothetical protein
MAQVHTRRQRLLAKSSALLVLTVGAYFYLGHTLSANININTAQSVEFGQGALMATACSGSTPITVTPTSAFSNAPGGGTFYFSSVTISGIPAACANAKFTLNAYNNTGNAPLTLFGNNQSDAVFAQSGGNYFGLTGSNGMAVTTNSSSSVTLAFTSPLALASNTFKITLQSANYSALTTSMCGNYLGSTTNTQISVVDGTCIVTFTSGTNTFTPPASNNSIALLVVGGGGGGGGGAFAGGGGAGGLIYNAAYSVTPGTPLSVGVGAGGTAGQALLCNSAGCTDNSGGNGGNTTFGALTAVGGGGGGGYVGAPAASHTIDANSSGVTPQSATNVSSSGSDSSKGKGGGSGGGSAENTYHRGGNTAGQGNIGGTALLQNGAVGLPFTVIAAGGGGGGAGTAGGDAATNHVAGAGGDGLQYSISGSSLYYAGGGGGGTESAYSSGSGAAGRGGGGAGGNTGAGAAGATNTGGGGGGAGYNSSAQLGGAGGSGVVIIRFNP